LFLAPGNNAGRSGEDENRQINGIYRGQIAGERASTSGTRYLATLFD
jgi:hypothetical protein